MVTRTEATIEDLYNAPRDNGTYELVNGELVHMSPTGFAPSRVAGQIYRLLAAYEDVIGSGYALTDNTGYVVNLPHRRSFSPDASFTLHAPDDRMRFIEGAPVFAAEVRSEGDYSPVADRAYAAKRRDYFAAGTLVVWDVDPVQKTIASYRAAQPDAPTRFAIGDTANAEPALPGWRVAVGAIFRT
ncbi:MAG: Uma2 family endonuclease [Thermomicrobia bacterium]|nr:Uma2 family endonuclease [Thermomicrobia bacterium]